MNEKTTVAQLRERLNKDVNDVEAAQSLGNFYFDNGEAAPAILYYKHVLELDPERSGVRTDMGTMYWRSDNLSLSEKAFREAIARDPGFGQAYVNLGLLLHRGKGNVVEARSVWQQLLSVNPDHEVAGKARELLRETSAAVN